MKAYYLVDTGGMCMDTLIEQLTEIETAASQVLDGAKNQKLQLDQEQQERLDTFDKEADAAIEQELAALQKELAETQEKQLKTLHEEADKAMEKLTAFYDTHHEELADNIFNRIIRK